MTLALMTLNYPSIPMLMHHHVFERISQAEEPSALLVYHVDLRFVFLLSDSTILIEGSQGSDLA